MTEIISVRFNELGKEYYFSPGILKINKDEKVIVETAKGLEYGICTRGNHFVDDALVVNPLRPVIRIADSDDNISYEAGKEKEKEALAYCQSKIDELKLEMKLISVEYGFEGNKIIFFFTSDGRVDFRDLVKDLAGKLKARIELRQIGVRDEAKLLGGLGVCGKQFCCTQFLTEFHPVSIKMAKTQGLSLNPAKISGSCGRLMCCLKYEEAAYEDLVVKAPKIGAFVETPSGKGSVININILRRQAKVRLEDGFDTTLKTFTFDEIDILGGKGRRAEYVTAKAEGRLEEAGFTISPPPLGKPFISSFGERTDTAFPGLYSSALRTNPAAPQAGPHSAPQAGPHSAPHSAAAKKPLKIFNRDDEDDADTDADDTDSPGGLVRFKKIKGKKSYFKKRK